MKSKFKYLVVGGESLIGSALVQFLRKANESFIYTSRRKQNMDRDCLCLDLSENQFYWNDIDCVDVAVLCAGITKVDVCENNKATTKLINVENMFKLASMLADKGTHIIYLSSNAVFDGAKEYPTCEDPVSPITEYGKQKADVERLLINNYASSVTILRLTKVLGLSIPLFDDWVLSLRNGNVIHPFCDMFIAPISVSFVISVIRLVADRRIKGILQLSGNKDYSYADIAFIAADMLGAKKEQVKPIRAEEPNLHRSLIRTSKTALNINRLRRKLGIIPPESLWTIRQSFLSPKNIDGGA